MSDPAPNREGRWRRALGRSLLATGCLLGATAGAWALVVHLGTDPLADVHAYYDAGARLNSGDALYPPGADTTTAGFYRYPPLLAIAFRPLALLPFPIAAAIWEAVVLLALVFTIRRVWRTSPSVRSRLLVAICLLALPIAWACVVGQAQVPVTWLVAVGSPAAIALAANLKLFPLLVALHWVAHRDGRKLLQLAGWLLGLALVQLILEPAGSAAFLRVTSLEEVGQVNNLSPYAVSPELWALGVIAGGGLVLLAGRRRIGWPLAVAWSVLATPRLLSYMLMTLLAALAAPTATAEVRAVTGRVARGRGRRDDPDGEAGGGAGHGGPGEARGQIAVETQ